MATIKYRLRSGKANPAKIYIRLRGKGFDAEAVTEKLVFREQWNPKKQNIRGSANNDEVRKEIDSYLRELRNYVINEFNTDYHEGKTIDTNWLKPLVASFSNQSTGSDIDKTFFLKAYADSYVEESKIRTNKNTGKKLSIRTIQDFQDTVNKIESYEKFSRKSLRFADVDLKFHKDFISFLRDKQLLGDNTIGAKIDNIKAFLRDAEINKIKVNPEYKSPNFYSPSFKPTDIYFDENEILKIKNHQFEFGTFLDNARDWLIIGLWTGLRVSDLLGLTAKDLKDGFIDNTNFKTKIPVTIPIHPYVKEILIKRDGRFPRKISDQNFNDYIKKVAEEVGFIEKVDGSKMCLVEDEEGNPKLGLDGKKMFRKKEGRYCKYELVTSHICRRSFASNLYGEIDTLTIMKITGHTTEKQFLQYIKITPRQHAERLSELWAEKYKSLK